MELFDHSSTPSSAQTAHTPEHFDTTFCARLHKPDLREVLMINTNIPCPRIYGAGSSFSYFPGILLLPRHVHHAPRD